MRENTKRRLRADVHRRAFPTELLSMTRCAYCGIAIWKQEGGSYRTAEGGAVEHDHIIPECRNGSTSPDNTVLACVPCNRAKGARPFGDPRFLSWLQDRREQVWLQSLPMRTADQIRALLDELGEDE